MSKAPKSTKLPKGEYAKGASATNPYGKNGAGQNEFITNILELPGNKPRPRKYK